MNHPAMSDELYDSIQGGEISEDALRQLNHLLDAGPGENASDEEMDAFMAKILAIDGGAEAIKNLAEQIVSGGVSPDLLPEENESASLYQPLQSALRLVFRCHLNDSQPEKWCRLSLASDASFFDLHCALQDAFDWRTLDPHRFEIRAGESVEIAFGSVSSGSSGENLFCEFQNLIVEVFQGGCDRLFYLSESSDFPEVVVQIEKITADDSATGKTPHSPRLISPEQAEPCLFRDPAKVLRFGVMPSR